MTDFSMIQVSDMHLSRSHPYFVHNWEVVLEQVNKAKPDLVISTGDLALNGPFKDDDFKYVREQIDRIEAPVFTVPGNHDIGNNLPNIRNEPSVNDERRRRYRHYVGEDYWTVDKGVWRLIGLNSLLFGSELKAETEQLEWFQSVLSDVGRRSIALFFHKPLFIRRPEDNALSQACVMPEPRATILDILRSHDVRLLATGHLHEYRVRRLGRTRLIWAPSTAYILNGANRPRFGGRRRVGYLYYEFKGRNFHCELEEPVDLINHDLSNWFREGIASYRRNIDGAYRGPL